MPCHARNKMNAQTDTRDVHESEQIRVLVGRARIRELTIRSNVPGLAFMAAHIALIFSTGYLLSLSLGSWWVMPATFMHGIGVVHLFAPFHETAHNTPFRSMWLNRTVGLIIGPVLGLLPHVFRYQHAEHHTHTQVIGRDPQAIPMAETIGGFLYYASSIPYFQYILTTIFRHLIGNFNSEERRAVPESAFRTLRQEAYIFGAIYLILLLGSIWFQSWAVLIYWLIPRIVAEPVERIIRMSEHVGCPRVGDILFNTRTILTFAPMRWLSWNMAYHAEHHAIPLVPFHKLGKLHEVLHPHLGEMRESYIKTVQHMVRNGIENSSKARNTTVA